jgi:hypothetical protein
MESTATIGNGGPNIRSLLFFLGSFSAWGVTRIISGLLLARNQVLLVLVGLVGFVGEEDSHT